MAKREKKEEETDKSGEGKRERRDTREKTSSVRVTEIKRTPANIKWVTSIRK